MKLTNFFKKLGLFGISASLIFSLPSCNGNGGGEEGVAGEGVYEEEEVLADDGGLYEGTETETVNVTNEGYYDSWDLDDDNLVNETEWEEGWGLYMTDRDYDADLYDEWDLNDDEFIDESEFSTAYYGYYDLDNDNVWNEDEFNTFSTNYYNTWDADNNDEIAENEFAEGWNTNMVGYDYDADLYNEWDLNQDEVLDINEFGEGMYGYWDADDSGYIEDTEYATYYTF